MLNEPSASSEVPIVEIPSPGDDLRSRLRTAVDEVFFVEFENDDLPILAAEGDRQVVRAVRGRINPPPRSWVPNLVLLVLTILSLLFVGALSESPDFASVLDLLRGWPYAL